MTEKSYVDIVAENFPSMDQDELFCKYLYLETYNNKYELHGDDYREWYRKHVIDNHQFMTKVFILRDPGAIKFFEDIINSHNFFRYIILSLSGFESLKETVDIISRRDWLSYYEIPLEIAEIFTANIIIPEKYNVIHEYNINNYRDLSKFFEDNPIKINFRVGYSVARLGDHFVSKFY